MEARARELSIRRRATAYATVAPADSFFCGVTAAVLWELPLPLRVLRRSGRANASEDRPIDVAVHTPQRAARAAGVRGRELAPELVSLRTVGGLRVMSPATTWAYLAADLTVDELVIVGDAIVRIPREHGMLRGTPTDALGTIGQLESAMDAGRRRGIAKLREALPQIRVGSASPPETLIRLACVRAGLPEPVLDIDVFDAHGRGVGFTELGYPEHRILIEYEGDHHRLDREQWDRDIAKHAACVALGWTVIRLTARHVYPTTDAAVSRIRDALVRAGWGA